MSSFELFLPILSIGPAAGRSTLCIASVHETRNGVTATLWWYSADQTAGSDTLTAMIVPLPRASNASR